MRRKQSVNKFKNILMFGALGAMTAIALPAQAQAPAGHDHQGAATDAHAAPAKAAEMSEGEVQKVDQPGKTITLKHGPLRNLDMPAMTMAFQVTDPSMLGKVKVGDKVRFVAANPGGKLTVTEIHPVK
jgi:Cu/Ag efflux protein CusF